MFFVFFGGGGWASLLSANCRMFSLVVFATMLMDKKKQRNSSHFGESRQSSENWTPFLWNNNYLVCFIELIYPLVLWVKIICCRNPPNHLIYILYHTQMFLEVMVVRAYFVVFVLILISTQLFHLMFLVLWIIITASIYLSYDIIETLRRNRV